MAWNHLGIATWGSFSDYPITQLKLNALYCTYGMVDFAPSYIPPEGGMGSELFLFLTILI